MGRIVDNNVKCPVPERHRSIVPNEIGTVLGLYVHAYDGMLVAAPESSAINSGIENPFWLLTRVKVEHLIQQLGIFSIPD